MEIPYDAEQRRLLLELARSMIIARVRLGRKEIPPCPDPQLEAASGCFVTIKQRGRLRGCIGTFSADQPLWRNVAQMAITAATGDPRFHPMQEAELADFTLEVSVLTPMRRIADVGEIMVGQHGLYLEKGSYRGVLLPQVATEYGWDRDTFLAQTCVKAGLPPGSWQSADCAIYTFSAQIFGDKEETALC